MTFENFNDFNNTDWQLITDQVMGGISEGYFEFLEEDRIRFIKMCGNVSLENNGGFIQVRKKINKKNSVDFKKISLKARGNNLDYFVHIRTKFTLLPWQYYQAKFSVSREWKTFNLSLHDFEKSGFLLPNVINAKDIKSIALVAFGKKQEVELDVSNIGLIY